MVISNEGRDYAEAVKKICFGKKTIKEDISLELFIFYPDKRKRDLDNFCGKSVLDALEKAGVFVDDSQVKELYSVVCGIKKPGYIIVKIKKFLKVHQDFMSKHK